NSFRGTIGIPKTPQKPQQPSPAPTHRRKRYDLETNGRLHSLLIDLLGRDQKSDAAPAANQFRRHGKPREQMAAGATTADGHDRLTGQSGHQESRAEAPPPSSGLRACCESAA